MPTFKSGAFAQQCFSSHPHSLTFKALTLIAPAGQTELARPGALFNLRDGVNQPGEKPSTSDPPTISPSHPGIAETMPLPTAPSHPESGISPTLPKPAETGFPSRRTDSLPLGAAEIGSIPIYRVV